jgi:nucleoside-diphosphate-sugar epimerase
MIDVRGKRVLITGGLGFIGHNLGIELHRLGADVTLVDGLMVNNYLSLAANSDQVPHPDLSLAVIAERMRLTRDLGIATVIQDARDYHAISSCFATHKPEVVVHLAAVSHANRSNKSPYTTFDHSLRTLENALDASKNRKPHFIFFSSSMVYGQFRADSVTEDTVCEPLGIYGALKYAGEKIVIAYKQVFDLPYTIIRPSALYGERCVSRRVGQIFIENALYGDEITINGDGSDALDFTYIRDLVDGVIRVIASPASRDQIFNMTYGDARSISQMAEILREHFPTVRIRYQEKDRLMPDRGTLSVDKARRMIGYEPQWTLEKGFPEYIRWYKELFAAHPELVAQRRKAS